MATEVVSEYDSVRFELESLLKLSFLRAAIDRLRSGAEAGKDIVVVSLARSIEGVESSEYESEISLVTSSNPSKLVFSSIWITCSERSR